MKNFYALCGTQFLSLLGSSITAFAVSLSIYMENQSVLDYAIMLLCIELPHIVLSPYLGKLVDSFERRNVMIAADSLAALANVSLLTLLLVAEADLVYMILFAAVVGIAKAIHMPAYSSLIAVIVKPNQLMKANSMVAATESLTDLVAPVMASSLLVYIGLKGILSADLVFFVIAVTLLLCIRFVPVNPPEELETVNTDKDDKSIAQAFAFFREKPAMLNLVYYHMIANFIFGCFNAVLVPHVLNYSTESELGLVMSVGAAGSLFGSILVNRIRFNPFYMVVTTFVCHIAMGSMMLVTAANDSMVIHAISLFILFAQLPFIFAVNQSIWQMVVPQSIFGRVISTRRMLTYFPIPVALIMAGVLVEFVLEPWFEQARPQASQWLSFIGYSADTPLALVNDNH